MLPQRYDSDSLVRHRLDRDWFCCSRSVNDGSGGIRHAFRDRWPSVLEAGLVDTRVISEGLVGRTTAFDDTSTIADRNGSRVLPTLLASHAPLDLVILMLGANDLKPGICGTAEGAAAGIRRLAEIVRRITLEPCKRFQNS